MPIVLRLNLCAHAIFMNTFGESVHYCASSTYTPPPPPHLPPTPTPALTDPGIQLKLVKAGTGEILSQEVAPNFQVKVTFVFCSYKLQSPNIFHL